MDSTQDAPQDRHLAPLLVGTLAPGFTLPQLGARLLGISVDHVYCHAAFARDAQLRFPLLADFQPRGRVARRYGVFRQAEGLSARALFVLDQHRRIRFSQAYPDFFNPGVDDILTTLETIASEEIEINEH